MRMMGAVRMKSTFLGIISVTAGLLLAPDAAAAPLLIDDFVNPQGPVATTTPVQGLASEAPAPDTAFGTTRRIFAGSVAGGFSFEIADGRALLTLPNGGGNPAVNVVYPASEAPTGIDLTGGGTNDAFFVDFLQVGASPLLRVSLRDDGGMFASSALRLGPSSTPTIETLMFAEFLSVAPGLDLTSITSITLQISGVAFVGVNDFVLAEIDAFRAGSTVIPLPAPAFLLLGGLGALAVFRRRC